VTDPPFGRPARRDPGRAALIKRWAIEAFGLDDDAGGTVMVTELRCTEPGCPPLETVIALLGDSGPPRQHKIHKPMAEVTAGDLARLAAPGDHPDNDPRHP
jgi:hypothetical protein